MCTSPSSSHKRIESDSGFVKRSPNGYLASIFCSSILEFVPVESSTSQTFDKDCIIGTQPPLHTSSFHLIHESATSRFHHVTFSSHPRECDIAFSSIHENATTLTLTSTRVRRRVFIASTICQIHPRERDVTFSSHPRECDVAFSSHP